MADYSWFMVGGHHFLPVGYSYDVEVAALFSESERQPCRGGVEDGAAIPCGYLTTARILLERLHALGITPARVRVDLAAGLGSLANEPLADGLPSPIPSRDDFLSELRSLLATAGVDDVDGFDRWNTMNLLIEELRGHMETRSLLRVLLECGGEQALAALDLTELDCDCTTLDPHRPVASEARRQQLSAVAQDAPLLVLTEGSTDASLLELGMRVTHPHLVGFVNFMDFQLAPAEGSVGALVKAVDAFIAAGVANRFVAIADNDTAAHDGFGKLKSRKHPSSCRVLHYPPLGFLAAYPARESGAVLPVPTDVNGAAGSLEMYLGRDVLTGDDGMLMPVQWGGLNAKMGRRQGALSAVDKKTAQQRFRRKAAAAQAGKSTGIEDWDGIRAIVDSIVHAFDDGGV